MNKLYLLICYTHENLHKQPSSCHAKQNSLEVNRITKRKSGYFKPLAVP